MRGFGRSRIAPENRDAVLARGYELETFADDLLELLNVLGLDTVWLNSHSTGASVAVFFTNRYGDRVKQSILTCNGVFEYDKKAFEAFYQFGGYVVAFRPNWLKQIPLMPRIFMSRFLSRPIPAAEKYAFFGRLFRSRWRCGAGHHLYRSEQTRHRNHAPSLCPAYGSDAVGCGRKRPNYSCQIGSHCRRPESGGDSVCRN